MRRIGFLYAAAVENPESVGTHDFRCEGWALALAGESRAHAFTDSHELLERLAGYSTPLRLFMPNDRELVQLLVDGLRAVKFGAIRGGTVISASVLEGHVLLQNASALFGGLELRELLRVNGHEVTRDAESVALRGLESVLRLGERLHTLAGFDPLQGNRRTAAGISMEALQLRYDAPPVYLGEREAFRGGRNEGYDLSEKLEGRKFDINSSYARSFTEAPGRDELLRVRVKVSRDCYIPPFFHAPHKKLIFPCGTVESWVFRSNLQRYYEPHREGWRVEKIMERHPADLRWLTRAAEYIREIYKERQEAKARGDAATAIACKALLVGAFGKLGLTGEIEIAAFRARPPHQGIYYRLEEKQFLAFRSLQKPPGKVRANYHLAAFVADNGRARLFDSLVTTTEPVYCDTDAMITTRGQPDPISDELGAWKYEGTDTLTVRGSKDYEWGGTVKRKGGEFQRATTVRAWARTGKIIVIKRERRAAYDKRRVLRGGKTAPLEVKP